MQYPAQMDEQAPPASSSRETRLLLATIAVSVVMLFVLARFRFPEQRGAENVEPAPAPLERLASQGSFDDLASSVADLDRRVGSVLMLVRVEPSGTLTVAARVTPDRAVLRLADGESLGPVNDLPPPSVIGRDPVTGIAVVSVEPDAGSVAAPRIGPPRMGPRYIAVASATPRGVALLPHFVADTASVDDAVSGLTLVTLTTSPADVAPGSALFSFAGSFLGIVSATGPVTTVVPAGALAAFAENPPPAVRGDLGVKVQALTDALGRIAGAASGVMVSDVATDGPADGALAPGDVVQSIDSRPVTTPREFAAVEEGRAPGRAIPVVYVRRGTAATVELTPRPRPEAAQPAPPADELGVALRTTRNRRTITTVRPGSAGARAGLEAGDVVVAIDAKAETGDLTRAFRALAAGTGLLVTVERDGSRRVLALEKR